MKGGVYIIGAAWLLSLGAAYLVGSGAKTGSNETREDRTGASGTRSGQTTSKSAPRGTQSGAMRDRSDRGSGANSGGLASGIVASRTPRQAVVELAQLTDPVERAKGFLALIDSLSADQFRDVVADFRDLGMTQERMSEYGMLLHAWARADPVDALDYAMKNTGTPFARQTILASWAAEDPQAAITFARANHSGDEANPLLVGVIRGIAPHDLNGATVLLQDLPYSRERGDALQTMLPFVMQDGIEVALSWTEGIADERLKSGALTYIVSNLSESDPAAAAGLLVTLDNNEAALRVADDVAGSLARADLQSALTWSQSLAPDLRAEATEGIISHYASQDPQAASQWLQSLAGTTDLDPAIRSFAWTAQRSEPQLAAEWIGQVTNERQRNELYNGVLSRWLRSDTEAAQQWIESAPDLPDNVRQLPERMRGQQGDRNQRGFDYRSNG